MAGPFAFWDPRRHSFIGGPAGLCLEQLLRKVRATLGSSYSPTQRAVPGGKTGAPADLRVDLGSLCRHAGMSERRLLRDEDARLIWLLWGSILSALKLAGGKGHSQARTRGNSEALARGPRHPTGLSGHPGTRAPGRLALRAVPPNSREAALLSCSRSLRGRAPGKLCKRTRHFVAQDRSASLPSPGGREQGGVHSCMALSYSLAPLLHLQKNKMNARPADLLGSWSRSDVLCKVSMPKRSSMSAACTQKVLHKCLRCSGWVCQQSQLHSRSLD